MAHSKQNCPGNVLFQLSDEISGKASSLFAESKWTRYVKSTGLYLLVNWFLAFLF